MRKIEKLLRYTGLTLAMIGACFSIVGCDKIEEAAVKAEVEDATKPKCATVVNQMVRRDMYTTCLKFSADGRKGRDYQTNDDEDWDEVVSACQRSAYYAALETQCTLDGKTWNDPNIPL